jgi:hypothetical protein
MMLIDLHVHTKFTQPWGSVAGGVLTHKEAITRAKAAGLDAICFTERFRPAGIEEALQAGREESFPVFIGVDIPALRGRLLFIPNDAKSPEFLAAAWADRTVPLTAEELTKQLAPLGVLFVVTPYSREVGRAPMCDRAFMVPHLNGVEAFTGYSLNDETAEELAVELGLARSIVIIGGSDVTDDPSFIGKAATLLRRAPKSQAELCEILRAGDAWSVQLGRQPAPVSEERYDRPREFRGGDRGDRGDRGGDRGDRRGPRR